MRIAVVAPVMRRVHGLRITLCLARALSRAHDVTVYGETVLDRLIPEIERQIAPARLRALQVTSSARRTNLQLLVRQLRRGPDRRLSHVLRVDHRQNPFDCIVVFANEGHWIADYVSAWTEPQRPMTVLVVLDPIDQVFLLARDRPYSAVRQLLMPLYPMIHAIESRRLRRFDRVFSISRLVSEVTSFLYGVEPTMSLAAVDADLFRCPDGLEDTTPYVAVPTVSLRPGDDRLLKALLAEGLPLVTFGPREVPGIPHRGFLPDDALVPFLGSARSTLFLFDYEGLGLLPLESLFVGTPVITLPKGGPFVELQNNPFVHFADDIETLGRWCRQTLQEGRTVRDVDRIRESVRQYAASEVADRLSRSLEESRPRSPPPPPVPR